jgi:transcriptional regulator with XRE-family HTH domain
LEINAVVSENARRLREEKRLTLDEAARLTGVSRSMLAQIEKGDVNPTISMVWKIANGYKVSFTSLVEPARERPVLLRGDDAPILEEDGERYRNCPAFPFDGERGFETYRIVMLPGGALEAQPHLPGTEEYVTVFAGEAEIGLPGETYRLRTGDSLRFPADQPHRYRNPGTEETQLSMLIWYRH